MHTSFRLQFAAIFFTIALHVHSARSHVQWAPFVACTFSQRPSKIGREDYEAGSRDGAIVVDGVCLSQGVLSRVEHCSIGPRVASL